MISILSLLLIHLMILRRLWPALEKYQKYTSSLVSSSLLAPLVLRVHVGNTDTMQLDSNDSIILLAALWIKG